MGWKSVKQHYQIGHIVQMRDDNLCIGSAYISELIVVDPDGRLVKIWDRLHGDLARYHDEITANPTQFSELLAKEDQFSASIPVYTWAGSEIVEKLCEEPGWPNLTHDGLLMHDNCYSPDRDQVVLWAKRDAASAIRILKDSISATEQKLFEQRALQRKHESYLAVLDARYPTVVDVSMTERTASGEQ